MSEALGEKLDAAGLPIGVSVLCPGAVATDIAATGRQAAADGLRHSDAAREYVERLAGPAAELLATHGVDPDVVGRMVVAAVHDNARFVFTDRAAEHKIEARTRQLLDSMLEPTTRQTSETIYETATSLRDV